jgi:phosphopantothenoylcysteine decarboxylase/phosphopantothenate--cysteine ligase
MLIALGVCGGIGAYKAVEVVRGLQKRGHEVVAIMTHSATRFVGPITFEAITRRQVITDQFAPGMNADIEHIALASSIDLLLIAPATANIIGKLANGIADDFLTTLFTATRAPLLLAPSMNTQMFEHEAVRKNLHTLAARGARFVEPGEGYLACGWIGKGRLAEPAEIVEAAEIILRPPGPLRGRRVLVTAGPTYEDVDPVRYIGNRSSGRTGFAIAAEAARRGAEVTLVAGPTSVEAPVVREIVRVRRASEMHEAVLLRADTMDVVVMAAAVADYTPACSGRRISLPILGAGGWRTAAGLCWSDSRPRPRMCSGGLARSARANTSISSSPTMCHAPMRALTSTSTKSRSSAPKGRIIFRFRVKPRSQPPCSTASRRF